MLKSLRYRYRIYPTETQKVFLAQSFGSARFIYNHAIERIQKKSMIRNSRLAKRIQTLGWGRFRQELQYQCDKLGRILVVVDRFFPSSKLCHDCGYRFTNLKAQKRWTCPVCGSVHDRDENAAANLKAEGLRILRTGSVLQSV